MYEYSIKNVVRVIDGDTVDVEIDLGFSLTKKERIRLAGIDTPETRTKNDEEKKLGIDAKEYLTMRLDSSKNLIVKTEKDLVDMGYDPSKLSEAEIALLADYTYNVGSIKKFPNFTDAIVNKDYDKARKEYQRKSGDKFLTKRNKATLAYINNLEKQQSG